MPKCFYPAVQLAIEKRQIRLTEIYYEKYGINPEIKEILEYIKSNGLLAFPYTWADTNSENYKSKISSVIVSYDNELNLPYTIWDEKRLYYPRDMNYDDIRKNYCGEQFVAQHPTSPHRYTTPEFYVNAGDIVVDCGAAEGNFGLSVVERARKLYLFEPEERWMEPLHATFAPWKKKVFIIQKYLSNVSEEITVSLDDFFSDKECPNFLKMDVEGYEEHLLRGAEKILSSSSMKKVVACTYHKADDEMILGKLLQSKGYDVSPSMGYMIFYYYDYKQPYIRRGVIRATKK